MLIKQLVFILGLLVIVDSITAQPVITSFSPLSGLPGSTVTVNGSNFATTPSENIVFVGGARAYVITASPEKLTVQVPRGVTNKPISLTVNNLTGFSAVPYITTFKAGNVITPGTFATPQKFVMEGRAFVKEGLLVDDVDNDGKPDVFATGSFAAFDNFYAVYRNISLPGNVNFDTPIVASLPFTYETNFLPLIDIDGDGRKDIISKDIYNIDILLNNSTKGHISFKEPFTIAYDTVNEIFYAGAVDFDGDGKLDLYGFDEHNAAVVTKNTSSPGRVSFGQTERLPFNFYDFPYRLIDVNNDGKPDVLSITKTGSGYFVAISLNMSSNGVVSFASPKNIFPFNVNSMLDVADINKDGKPDVAISNVNDSAYFLLNITTSGNVSFAAPVALSYKARPSNTHFVDIDGDGRLDITGYDIASNNYFVIKNTSTLKRMAFANPVSFSSVKPGGYGKGPFDSIELADFDGDGRQDVAFTGWDYLSYISVLSNQTDTAKGTPSITSFSPTAAMQNDTLTIVGDNFNGTTNVTLGGTPVQSFNIVSNDTISAIVDRGSTGGLKVTTRKGMATKSSFTYLTDTIVKLISSVSGIACSGEIVRVKASVSNAYNGIIYRWYKNGKIEPISSGIYSSHALRNGDSLWCVVSFMRQASNRIWKSNVLNFVVNPSLTPKLRIKSSNGTLICKGTTVTFMAIVNNGDFKQVYQWQKNNHVVGGTTDTYVDNNLQNGDIIRCIIIKAQQCTVLPATDSLKMSVDVSRPLAPAMIVGPDEVSPAQLNVLFSVPQAASVRSYKWQIPPGAFFVSPNGADSVAVNWAGSTGKISVGASNACGVSPVITKTIRVTFSAGRIVQRSINKNVTSETELFIVYPNPANSNVTVVINENARKHKAIELRDVNGKLVLLKNLQVVKGTTRVALNTGNYPAGLYYVVLTDQNNKSVSKQLMIVK